MSYRFAVLALALTVAGATAGAQGGAQADPRIPAQTEVVSLDGPRFGVTFLTQQFVDSAKNHGVKVGTTITQFGWQWEKQFLATQSGAEALSEVVALVGGLDQGVVLPSLTWLVGIRTTTGFEVGAGPNLSAAGVGMALAAGTTARIGALNVPFNLAVVPSKTGPRVSMLTGFTLR